MLSKQVNFHCIFFNSFSHKRIPEVNYGAIICESAIFQITEELVQRDFPPPAGSCSGQQGGKKVQD